jgi:alcohol dehydrogenase
VRALVYDVFGERPVPREVPDPTPPPHGVVLRVTATGVCRSDWHAWRGHDPEVRVPHVGGHELAGVVAEVGAHVRRVRVGERVTVPFVCACGGCPACVVGDQQVCARQTQPGFTHWGSFAEYVVIHHADVNVVPIPDDLDDAAAAILGCRFGTAYRAVLRQGQVAVGDWVAVHGCGGVGLAAVMIAAAAGARVVAVDVSAPALRLARELGAEEVVDASLAGTIPAEDPDAVAQIVRDLTGGGARVSLDCLGSPRTCAASVLSVRRRGRHVQVGLLSRAEVPMDRVVAYEVELVGSHGLQAHEYPGMLAMVESGRLRPDRLVQRRIQLDDIPDVLAAMDTGASPSPGMTVAVLS